MTEGRGTKGSFSKVLDAFDRAGLMLVSAEVLYDVFELLDDTQLESIAKVDLLRNTYGIEATVKEARSL